ncbi:glycosyltransferase family 4 protein [Spirosoma fluminis]
MKILIATFLVPTSPSGVVTAYKALANDLVGEGQDVHVVDSSDTPALWRKALGVLKRIMRPLGGAASVIYDEFAYFTGLYLAVRKRKAIGFDVIHAQDVRSGVAAYLALGRQVPVVLTCHYNGDPVTELVTHFNLKPWFTRQLTAWYAYLFAHIEHYVFPSNYSYVKSKHLLPGSIHKLVLYNTINRKMLTGLKSREASDRVLISNVGYIDERKNQKLLIQIGHELRRRGIVNFAIWLIGDGPKRAEYEGLVEEYGLTEQVKFYGRQATPWQLVAQSDLYVHTSLNDNCPYSIVEAMAVKTPVLALPVGGIPEMLPEQYGPLRGTDVSDITSEVIGYFDPEKRTGLMRAQSVHADQLFNHRKALDQLMSFYQYALQRTTEPATAYQGQPTGDMLNPL